MKQMAGRTLLGIAVHILIHDGCSLKVGITPEAEPRNVSGHNFGENEVVVARTTGNETGLLHSNQTGSQAAGGNASSSAAMSWEALENGHGGVDATDAIGSSQEGNSGGSKSTNVSETDDVILREEADWRPNQTVRSIRNGTGAPMALLINRAGPSRRTGDGIRFMGVLLDLKECGFEVHALSENQDHQGLRRDWGDDVAYEHLHGVHLWTPEAASAGEVHLDDYERILFGVHIDMLDQSNKKPTVVDVMLKEISSRPGMYKDKVSIIFDDILSERCRMRAEAKEICPRAPALVEQLASVAHEFYTVTAHDRTILRQRADELDLKIPINTWPLRLHHMRAILPRQRFNADLPDGQRNLIAFMGNNHAVNIKATDQLFGAGVVETICKAIQDQQRDIKIVFYGDIAQHAKLLVQDYNAQHHGNCVEVNEGYLDEELFNSQVMPKLRAFINPFFFNVNSGVSVRNYEALMSGTPFLTSSFGMYGLLGEDACEQLPYHKDPENTSGFAQYVVDNVIDPKGYMYFLDGFQRVADKCVEEQKRAHAVQRICHHVHNLW